MYPWALGVVQLRGEIDPPLYGFIVEEMCFYYGLTSWRQIAFSCHGDVLISRMLMTVAKQNIACRENLIYIYILCGQQLFRLYY